MAKKEAKKAVKKSLTKSALSIRKSSCLYANRSDMSEKLIDALEQWVEENNGMCAKDNTYTTLFCDIGDLKESGIKILVDFANKCFAIDKSGGYVIIED